MDDRQISDTRLSSVQCVKFYLTPAPLEKWSSGASLVVDHSAYLAKRELTAAELVELAQDFA